MLANVEEIFLDINPDFPMPDKNIEWVSASICAAL